MGCHICKKRYQMKREVPICNKCQDYFEKQVDRLRKIRQQEFEEEQFENDILSAIEDDLDLFIKHLSKAKSERDNVIEISENETVVDVIIQIATQNIDENGYVFEKVVIHEKHFSKIEHEIECIDLANGKYVIRTFYGDIKVVFSDGNYMGKKFSDFMFELK